MTGCWEELNELTNTTTAIENLKSKCLHHNLTDEEILNLCQQVDQTVVEFSQRGTQLSDIGCQLNATRRIEHCGHEIIIEANFGHRQSLLKRLLSIIGL